MPCASPGSHPVSPCHTLSPRSGLLIYPEGPLSLERGPEQMSRVFSPFYNLLKKIRYGGKKGGDAGASVGWRWGGDTGLTLSPRCRDLLRVLSAEELCLLERSLCAAESEDPRGPATPPTWGAAMPGASPPAPWGLLEAPHTTPLPHTCTGRLGPPDAVESPGTDRHVGVCVGRERGLIFCATPWVTIASPCTAPSPPEVAQGRGSRPRRVPAGRSCARTTAAPRTCCTPSSSASQVSERLTTPLATP